ncbi:MAG: hypothetical protein AAEJ52_08800, partial [Myxococcota bacterium]
WNLCCARPLLKISLGLEKSTITWLPNTVILQLQHDYFPSELKAALGESVLANSLCGIPVRMCT